jgi:hypothetical protein
MAILEDKGTAWRKMLPPTAAGILGAGAGLFLTRKQNLRDAMPNFEGLGDLADDLRGKLDTVLGKAEGSDSRGQRHLSSGELERRRREREQRRNRRRARS